MRFGASYIPLILCVADIPVDLSEKAAELFTEEEIAVALGEIFRGMIFVIKSGNNPARLVPAENSSKEAEKIESHHPDLSSTKKQS